MIGPNITWLVELCPLVKSCDILTNYSKGEVSEVKKNLKVFKDDAVHSAQRRVHSAQRRVHRPVVSSLCLPFFEVHQGLKATFTPPGTNDLIVLFCSHVTHIRYVL